MKNVAVIIPVFNEGENLRELHKKLDEAVKPLKDFRFEFILVDDGSRDDTFETLQNLREKDNRVKFIRFLHNCGSHAALSAGLIHTTSDAAIVMAADLQDPPELIPSLVKKWQEGNNVVWAARESREGETQATKFFSQMYYFLMNILTNIKMPPKGADVFLIDRRVIEAFKQVPEKHTSIFLTIAWLGFKQDSVFYVKQARRQGKSKWTLAKKWKLFSDSIFAFSTWPVKAIGLIGLFLLIIGLIVNCSLMIKWFSGSYIRTDMFLWGGNMLVASIQVLALWVLGEFIYRGFDESRRRPKYIIEEKVL